jgi:hypothetical protein
MQLRNPIPGLKTDCRANLVHLDSHRNPVEVRLNLPLPFFARCRQNIFRDLCYRMWHLKLALHVRRNTENTKHCWWEGASTAALDIGDFADLAKHIQRIHYILLRGEWLYPVLEYDDVYMGWLGSSFSVAMV